MSEGQIPTHENNPYEQPATAQVQAPPTTVDYSSPVYHQNQYVIRRKVLKIFGAAFHIYDMAGNLAFYSKQKAFKLKEDIRIYGDQAMTSELLCIRARGVIDFGMTYDVIDSTTQQVVGSLKRKGLKSLFRDSWVILDVNDQEIGTMQEERCSGLPFCDDSLEGPWGRLSLRSSLMGISGTFLYFNSIKIAIHLFRKSTSITVRMSTVYWTGV